MGKRLPAQEVKYQKYCDGEKTVKLPLESHSKKQAILLETPCKNILKS